MKQVNVEIRYMQPSYNTVDMFLANAVLCETVLYETPTWTLRKDKGPVTWLGDSTVYCLASIS